VVNRLGDPLAMVAVVRGLREAIEAPARLVGGGAGVAAQA
jgi:hypothetical protein